MSHSITLTADERATLLDFLRRSPDPALRCRAHIAYYDLAHGCMYNENQYTSLNNIGPLSRFQQTPLPAASTACNPALTQTAHPGGMNVLLADGHVRVLAPSISGATWWAVCTP